MSKTNSSASSSPQTSGSTAKNPDTNGVSRVIEDKGRFRYIYEVDSKTKKRRLVRRVPVPKASVFEGKGNNFRKKRAK